LKQRIALRCTLQPFDETETARYISSRMEHAGIPDQDVFPEPLMHEIGRRTQGIPRLINSACENLLLTAFAMEQKVATLEMLDEVSADLRLEYSPVQATR
jgi:general secretion pathway protein A